METPPNLSTRELTPFLGGLVLQGDDPTPCRLIGVHLNYFTVLRVVWKSKTEYELREYSHRDGVRCFPILRDVTEVTESEWKAIYPDMGSSNGSDQQETIYLTGEGQPIITHWLDGQMSARSLDSRYTFLLKWHMPIDMLDKMGVDVRGYLKDGRAVPYSYLSQVNFREPDSKVYRQKIS